MTSVCFTKLGGKRAIRAAVDHEVRPAWVRGRAEEWRVAMGAGAEALWLPRWGARHPRRTRGESGGATAYLRLGRGGEQRISLKWCGRFDSGNRSIEVGTATYV